MPMRAIRCAAVLAALLTVAAYAPAAAVAQSAAGEGSALAQKFCADCHDVTDKSAAPSKSIVDPGARGPTFRDIAQKPVMTKLAIRVFMRSTHPSMPDIILSDGEIDALADYIISLR